ncbi:MAG: chromosome segregation protein SMC [Syntrophomonadaceae bacterium]|nr:chromosome segregation protein SMC [Syntrophomonadaceae bacterium]
MYLKRLDIKGFKSFAEYTTIHFEPGINIVVGPNGCGKSNIVDAVRWVLGENNVRNLRGSKGEDIIFCGTDSKRAHGMAAVEMLIDNADGFIPLEYREINLARKLFRSGESEFTINRTRVRMKDIHDLFAGTGLGKKGYAIISQGELEQLLNAQALDRRLILEEAAGIIKYRQQREEVNRRLLDTAQDLTRLSDLLAEMRERSQELQHKAEKARQFISYKQEADDMEKTLTAYEINRLQRDQANCQADLEERRGKLRAVQQQQSEQLRQLQEKERQLEDWRLKQQKAQQELYDAKAEMAELRSALQLSQERMVNYQERLKAAKADAAKYAAQLKKIGHDLLINRKDYEQQRLLSEDLEQQCIRLEKETAELEQSLAAKTRLFEEHKALLFAHAREESEVKNRLKEQQERLLKNRERRFRLKTQYEQLNRQLKATQQQHAQYQEEKVQVEQQLSQLMGSLQAVKNAGAEAARKLVQAEGQIQGLQKQINQHSSRLESLRNMRQSLSGYAPGVKAVMKWADNGELDGVLGIVGEILEVPPGLETAIEVAAGRSLGNIVVESSHSAHQVIERLKSQRAGRVTCLPLDSLRTREVPEEVLKRSLSLKGVMGRADRLVNCRPRFRVVVEYLLGRVLVVDSLNSGIQIFKKIDYPWTLVSLEGDIITPGGAMTGGTAAERGSSHLQRRAEENRLEKELLAQQAKMDQLKQALAEARSALEAIEQQASELKKRQMECSLKKDWLESQIKSGAEQIVQLQRDCQEAHAGIVRLKEEAQQIEHDLAAYQEQWQALQLKQQVDSSQLEEYKETLVKMRQDLEVWRERSASYREQLHMKKRELDNQHKNLLQFEAVQGSYRQSCQEAHDLLAKLQHDIETENRKSESIKQRIAELVLSEKNKRDSLETIKEQEMQCRNAVNQLKADLEPVSAEMGRLEQVIRQQEISLVRLDAELSGLYAQWREKLGETPVMEIDLKRFRPAELRSIRQELAVLKEKLEALGMVDISAIEESEALESRLVFLEKQYLDLGQARDSLLNLLAETERLMAHDFKRFMEQANQSFARTFAEMFNGGEGRLLVQNEASSLEAGVDIEVKIPGKRVQSLHLLSGGERALTCIAFLFALIRLKPIPFCILDEIDAALDEANLTRFTGFLRGMCGETQFIVVTHRQSTIECGHTIYGITMAEKGISQVYTLSLEDMPSKAG